MDDPSFGFRVTSPSGARSRTTMTPGRRATSSRRHPAATFAASGSWRAARTRRGRLGSPPTRASWALGRSRRRRLGEVDACKCMVEELGFDINAGSELALASAALDGRLALTRYLLDHGADPNKKDNAGSVPLHCAAKNGHDEVARLLLSRGASIDIAYFHGTPLHIAAAYGKAGVMKILLEYHADPNKVSEVLGTPLVAALHATSQGLAESISLKCVKLLVEAGADVNYSDRDTLLVVAITIGLTDCIKCLLKAGADPNIPTCHDKQDDQNKRAQLKLRGEKAVQRKDYRGTSIFYTEAIELDPTDATLYSNRCLCHLQMTESEAALFDADTCIYLRPEWLKGYYRKGAALMLLKEYKKACDAFMTGLKLDPGNEMLSSGRRLRR